jgi:hypothetical protein
MTMGKQENVTLTEPTSSHVNKLPAAHRPDAMAGGTGENAAHTHLPVLGDLPRVHCASQFTHKRTLPKNANPQFT